MRDHLARAAAKRGMLGHAMPAEHGFEARTVNQANDPPQGRWRRGTRHGRGESGLQQRETLLEEGTQALVGLRATQKAEDAKHQDIGETIPLRWSAAAVGHARQHLYERLIHRCNLSLWPHHGRAS